MPSTNKRILLSLLALLVAALPAAGQTKLLRFPDVFGDTVAFVYAGDLWLAPAAGGTARRLTAHPGVEVFPKFSPDGSQVAFTGQYDGDEQVYVMPTTGGSPRQLTYYPAQGPLPPRWGYDHQVYGWTPDGARVLFRSFADHWDIADGTLMTVATAGGLPEALPMPTAGAGAFSSDGHRIVYSPLGRDFRTWKRYQGGWAEDLFLFDLDKLTTTQLTADPRTDRDPMWIGDRVYFASDRDGTLNLYSMRLDGSDVVQHTHSTTWDVRWPSADEAAGKIVYELGGELVIFDVASGRSTPISIFVPDDGLYKRPSRVSAAGLIESAGLSPKGERALFVARGDVFTAPIEKGPTRNLTHSSGAHDKWASWSPDGKQIAFLSDRTGEEELYTVAQDGTGEPRQITSDGHVMRYQPLWSPDGKRIALSDKDGKLFVVTLADKSIVEVADDPRGQIFDYVWSPHGGHLAFSIAGESGFRSLRIWSVADGRTRGVTDETFNAFGPAWDPAGNYLYYLSDRSLAPQIGSFEFNYVIDRETDVYALALRHDVPHPFPPESDEVTTGEGEGKGAGESDKAEAAKGKKGEKAAKADKAKKGDEDDKAKDEEAAKEPITIDFEGLGGRVARVPIEGDNIAALAANDGNLLYVTTGAFYYGRESDRKPALYVFSIEDRKASVLAEGIDDLDVSADGSKVIVHQGDAYNVLDAKPGGGDDKKTVATDGLEVNRVPTEEWAQIFDEVWRRYRDFFYVTNMHGNDWQALRAQYRPLLAYVAHRSDLNYVLGEMVAELNVSHSYIVGGDFDLPDRPRVALPGARFRLDPKAGRYQIASIFAGDNAEDRYRSPLTEVGVQAAPGDYLLAIDGVEVGAHDNPYRFLRYKADRPVELTLNAKPTLEGARKVTFRPVDDEQSLVYLSWAQERRKMVEAASGGRVGYLHLPDMGADGIREFTKWYYGQIRKEGLVVDVRGNGGGNVSQMIIDRLRRTLLGVDFSRDDDFAEPYPQTVFYGPMVCLISETSASDGDIFPYMFRQAGLGPLIGKRTWGGVVGISGHGPLIDGGQVFVPEAASASVDGHWVIEGHGVDPDIEVGNPPQEVIAGRDPQLARGVAEVLKAIAAHPRHLPSRPPAPVRTKEHYDAVPSHP
jgi:tricorn protease